MRFALCCLFLALLTLGVASPAGADAPWTEGRNYFPIVPAQPTAVPRGKVEVTEVFSYACVVCNRFLPTMKRLAASMPAGVVVDYLPASFIPAEDWPVFQRAYLAAQLLGVADRAHDALFDAIWKTGELAIIDPATQRVKAQLPTIADVARFYHRATGVPVADFLATAASMGVETRMGQAHPRSSSTASTARTSAPPETRTSSSSWLSGWSPGRVRGNTPRRGTSRVARVQPGTTCGTPRACTWGRMAADTAWR